MARLYANENCPLPVVQALRQAGHDVTTVAETGRAEQSWPDTEVLDFATRDERILLTLNRRHFIRLHLQNQNHAGIIVCTFAPDFNGHAQRIEAGIKAIMDLRGQLIRVNRLSG
jgi:predicted nuclease of predicted toxin-antitoxin system